ncbi:MAG TPA: TIGR03790 family protein [Chthoniobacteraceae bacterium]|nr:TIGR03790 family protein [Chthoniobacteraceae bacterium]
MILRTAFAFLLLVAFLTGEVAAQRTAAPKPGSDEAATLVVFNESDPSSVNLAASYADKRGIPFSQMVALACPASEEITREQYEQTIATPLREMLVARGWWKLAPGSEKVVESSIRFVALMRGIPLKIAPMPEPGPRDSSRQVPQPFRHNSAAVDSELACLGMAVRQITGPVDNPYYGARMSLKEFSHPGLLLVCRLDAATPATVQRMIDDSVRAEKEGLWGFAYIDSRHTKEGGLRVGDEWLQRIADEVMRAGIPWVHENTPQLFPRPYPMRDAALYYGWYSGQVQGPFEEPGFRFAPGAVAVHIHSFSAATLREPLRNWCAPLLERGAAATLGNVYEPYLQMTPDLARFHQRLRDGATFAEAAYASQKVLSWMTTFIGDPLYRPFKGWAKKSPPAGKEAYGAYRAGARQWFGDRRSTGEAALARKGKELKSGLLFEGRAALQLSAGDTAAALASLEQARRFYSQAGDRLRCSFHAVGLLLNLKRPKEALALARSEIAAYPNEKATVLLKAIVHQLTTPPPTPAPNAGTKAAP